jgi:hypothetical protein
MSHIAMRPPRLRERITMWLLEAIERCAYSVLPRGPLRRRILHRVDAAFERLYLESCRKEGRVEGRAQDRVDE